MSDPFGAAYDRWKTTTPDDGPEEPTDDELDARDAMIDLEIEERLERERAEE